MSNLSDFYDELSEQYDRNRSNRYFKLIEEIEYTILNQIIKSNSIHKILEVGCGTGIFLDRIKSGNLDIYGIDNTWSMLEKANKKGYLKFSQLVNGDARYLPIQNETFDLIYSYKVVPHIKELEKALREMNRVLRKKGIAILEFYNPMSFKRLFFRGEYFHKWHLPNKAKEVIKANGFDLLETRGARIITPFSLLLEVPLLRYILWQMEILFSSTVLNIFAGYYILVCRKGNS